MQNDKLTVITKLKAKEGGETQLRDLLLEMADFSRKTIGNINYHVYCSTEDRSVFFVYENWTDFQAIDEYHKLPFVGEMMKQIQPLLAEPEDINPLKTVSKDPEEVES